MLFRSTAAEAASSAGFAAPQVSGLPGGIPAAPRYGWLGQSTGTFTFDAATAQAWAAAHGGSLPAMPSGMDGSSLAVTMGPAIVEMYGAMGPDAAAHSPALAVGKMKAPSVTSTGPSIKEIEDYLVSIPGVSPDLAAAIKAIGDPTTTLPLPVPVDRATTQAVSVHGAQGVLIGDDTGLGAGVIWIQDGYVYGVGGTLTQDQVMAIARSLH